MVATCFQEIQMNDVRLAFHMLKLLAITVVIVLALGLFPSANVTADSSSAQNNGVSPNDQSPTTTHLTAGPDPARVEWPIRLVSVIDNATESALTGTVTFAVNGSPFATVPVKKGAHWTETMLRLSSAGQYTLTATYSGDANNQPSVSAPLIQTIILRNSQVRLSTSGSPSHVGQPVTFTATVIGSCCAIPNGEVITFYDGKNLLGSAPTSGGSAQFTTSTLSAKTHSIKAYYPGDTTYKPSHGAVQQIVEP